MSRPARVPLVAGELRWDGRDSEDTNPRSLTAGLPLKNLAVSNLFFMFTPEPWGFMAQPKGVHLQSQRFSFSIKNEVLSHLRR